MSGKLFRQYIYCGILILFFLWLKSPAAFAQTVGRCANFTVSLSGGGSASQSDQFNTASSFPATNIIPRVPAPGETITFSSSGTGYFNINWIRPLGSPDTGCNFYIFTGNTGVMPNWKTGTLIRNDSYGTTNCQGKPLNFDNGVVYGNNWLGTATFTATTPWCRNIDQNSAQGYLYSGTTASTNRCANACIIQSLPNFSRSYTINGIPQCPAGKLPSTDLHLFYSVWPGANGQQLNWQYTPKNRSTMSFSSSSTYAGSSYYVGMEPVAGGAAFQPVGTKPHPLMNYQTNWVPSTWNAMWSIGLVPSGTYNITYQVPDNLCVAPTAPVFTQATCNAAGVMTLNWNPVAGVSSYALSAQNTSVAWDNCANTNGNYCSETVPSSSTTYSFQASPGKSYSVWMHGKYGDTYGPAGSDTVACNIPPPTGFSGVCSGKSATFTWTPAPGINTYYWRLRDLTTNTDVYNETLGLPNVTGSSFTYNAMTPGHNYRAWIHSQLPNVITPNWSAAVFSEFACPLPSPTPLPSATPTPTPTYTPTPSPLPSGYCTTSANCTGGQVCANNGCVVPSPTPSATATPTPTTAPTSTPVLSPTPNCSLRNHGDANCDCVVDAADYTIWRNEFLNLVPQERADFSSKAECKDTAGKPNFVCTFDLDIWRDGMTRGLTCDNTQPTGGPTATPIPASTVIPTAVPTGVTPSPTPLPSLTPTTAVPTTTPPVLPPLVDSNYLGVKTKFIADESINLSSTSISSVNVVFARQVTWRDGCMGCGGTVCTQALTSGYRVVVSGPSNTQTGKCVYRAYHFKTNATTMCNESPNARIVTDCGADPIPAPADGVAQ